MRFADYFEAFNRCDDAALVRDFWAEDCVMESAGREVRGHGELMAFLNEVHDGILEIMRPQYVMEQGDRIFVEVDMDFHATKDKPDYVFGSLKKGEMVTVKFFAFYRTKDGKVAHLKTATWPPGKGVSKPQKRLGGTLEQRKAYLDYTRAFSNADFDEFGQYYTEDCECEIGSLRMIGRDGIVGFYRDMFRRVRETLTLHQLIADENGLAADVTSTFTAIEDASDFAPMPLRKGEVREVPVLVCYKLRDGLISHISVGRKGPREAGV